MPELLSAAEAAARCRLSPKLLRRLIRDGIGPRATRLGTGRGRLFISEAELAVWLAECTEPRATAPQRCAA